MNNQEIEKLANGERLAELVRKIEDRHDRDIVVGMCSGVVEGFLLATNYQNREVKHGV